jgi:hypothetical protein
MPWRGPAHQQAQLGNPLCLQGLLWGPHHLSLGVWGWGSQPIIWWSDKRAYANQVFCHQAPIGPERFDLPPTPFANANIGAISG